MNKYSGVVKQFSTKNWTSSVFYCVVLFCFTIHFVDAQDQENDVLSMSPQRNALLEYLQMDELSLNKAGLPFQEGGLSPGNESFSFGFWMNYSGKTAGIVKDTSGNEKIDIMHLGGFLEVNGYNLNLDRGLNLTIKLNGIKLAVGSNRVVIPDEWYHLCFVFNASSGMFQFYQNGRLAFEASYNPDNFTFSEFFIGAQVDNQSLGLSIDDIFISKTNLSVNDAAWIFSNPGELHQEQESLDLVALWDFEDAQEDESFVDRINAFRLEMSIPTHHIQSLHYSFPQLTFEPSTSTISRYYPSTYEDKVLFEYLQRLAECETDQWQPHQPLVCRSDPFEIPLDAGIISIETDTLLKYRPSLIGIKTAEAFQFLTDLLRVPKHQFAVFYEPIPLYNLNGTPNANHGIWWVPVHPFISTITAVIYDNEESWNTYGYQTYGYQDQLKNRIVLNSIVQLLDMSERMYHSQPQGDWAFDYGFYLKYSALSLIKLAPHFSEEDMDVVHAWHRILDRCLRQLWALTDKNCHRRLGTSETNMSMQVLVFVNHLIEADQILNVDPQYLAFHKEVRDEWTKLFIEPKTSGEARDEETPCHEGDYKGFSDSGYEYHEGSISGAYFGNTLGWVEEIVNRALHYADLNYAQHVADTLRLAYSMSNAQISYDQRLLKYFSASSFSQDPTSFEGLFTGSKGSELALLGKLGPRFDKLIYPTLFQNLSDNVNILNQCKPNCDPGQVDDISRIKINGIFDVASTTAEGVYVTNVEVPIRANLRLYTLYKRNRSLSSLYDIVQYAQLKRDFFVELYEYPELSRYPVERFLNPNVGYQGFGVQDDVDWHVFKNPFYQITFSTIHTIRGYQKLHAAVGTGINSLTIRNPRKQGYNQLFKSASMMSPILEGWIGDTRNTYRNNKLPGEDKTAYGLCVVESDGHLVRVPSNPETRSSALYLEEAGNFDAKEWPLNYVLGIPQGVTDQEGAQEFYSTSYYNVSDYQVPSYGQSREFSMTLPFYKNFRHTCLDSSRHDPYLCGDLRTPDELRCFGGQLGGCVNRDYKFLNRRIQVSVTLGDFGDLDTSEAFSLDSNAQVYEVLPIFYFSGLDDENTIPPEANEIFFRDIVQFYVPGRGWIRVRDPGSTQHLNVRAIRINQTLPDRSVDGSVAGMMILFPSITKVRIDSLPVAKTYYLFKNLLFEFKKMPDLSQYQIKYTIIPYFVSQEDKRSVKRKALSKK